MGRRGTTRDVSEVPSMAHYHPFIEWNNDREAARGITNPQVLPTSVQLRGQADLSGSLSKSRKPENRASSRTSELLYIGEHSMKLASMAEGTNTVISIFDASGLSPRAPLTA